MKISRLTLASILARRTLSGKPRKALALSMAAYLLQHKRTGELGSLLRDTQAEWAANGYLEVEVAAARLLPGVAVRDIRREARKIYPAVKKITITERLDSTVLNGAVVRFVDYEMDLSARRKLAKLRSLAARTEAN